MFKQWKNSEEVIDWFEKINNKKSQMFHELCHQELLPNHHQKKTPNRCHLLLKLFFKIHKV